MKTCIFALMTTLLLGGYGVSAKADLMDGLILYFNFDEKGDKVLDGSGNNNHGEIQGGAKRVAGKFEGGMEFDGTTGFLLIPYNANMDAKDQVTMAAWIRAGKKPGIWLSYLISKWNYHGGNGRCYFLGIHNDNGGPVAYISNDGTDATNKIVQGGEVAFGKDKWQHLAATFDGSKFILWLDGQNVKELDFKQKVFVDPNKSGMSVAAGSFGKEAAARFPGVLDEVIVYNRALTPDELQKLIKASLLAAAAVEPAGKLATAWARLKVNVRNAH